MAGKEDRILRINSQEKPLPKAFVDWMDKNMPVFIVYESGKKIGRCTRCGAVSEYKKLKYNTEVRCPNCGKKAVAKTEKRLAGKKTSRKFIYIQKIHNGIMCRFIEREYQFSENGEVCKTTYETLRAAVEKGRRQYWYEKYFSYGRQYYNGWRENNKKWSVKSENNPLYRIAGMGGWSYRYEMLGAPRIYWKNKQGIIKDSLLRFYPNQAADLIDKVNEKNRYRIPICGFLDVYEKIHQYPCLESLYKCGLEDIVCDYIYNPKLNLKRKEHEPHRILGMRKELFREVRMRKNLEQKYINKVCFMQKVTTNIGLILKLAGQMELRDMELFFVENRMPPKKTAKYMAKIKYSDRIIYRDYINMAKNAGSDMTSEFVLFPRDLQAAHDAMIEVRDAEKNRKEREKAKKKDSKIERVFKKIEKKFSYEDEKYILRPAKSNVEIVKEGQTQHICVGYGGYADKMIRGESYILFLRKKESPEEPYYTVEIDPDYEILQRHGKYNKEGEEKEEIDAFLEKFQREVGHVGIGATR